MTHAAVGVIAQLALGYDFGARLVGRRRRLQIGRRWWWGRHRVRTVQLERQHARNVALVGLRIMSELPGSETERPTPTDLHTTYCSPFAS